ncbi:putative adenylate cyclase [Mycobacterium kansasii]|uniref:Putative adenylate cyclase n=1 Tax=Mycobacterium kansasii TaxID=1768 RepID=A0A1V3X452_MYCKA|nr:putative adenylate cyclase [Mycobacterium kansasii]
MGFALPNCRGTKVSVATLSELPHGAHCPSCNIDYDRDFERNVELTFAPAATVRPLPGGRFCLSGPMETQHVAVQVLLAAGERRDVAIDLPPGSYRLRTLHPNGFVDIDYQSGAFPGLRITGSGVEILDAADREDAPGRVTFVNDAGFELGALIEDRTWARETLTAPEVISLQAFAICSRRRRCARATMRGSARSCCYSPTCGARRPSTNGSAMPLPTTWCASTSRCWPRSCETMTVRWSRRSVTRSWPHSPIRRERSARRSPCKRRSPRRHMQAVALC